TIGGAFRSSFGVDELSTVRKLLAFVDGLPADRPFFAVYSPIAGHHPYHAPGDGPRPFAERTPADAYANDLFVSDAAFGELRAGLQRRGLDERTLYVIVGDHGEAFFEHDGNFAHAMFLYEENVRVPFVMAAPGAWRGVRRAPQLASLIDVAPTLLDLLGLLGPETSAEAGRDGDRAGHSLLDPRPRLVRFFTDQGLTMSALRDGRWKLIAEQPSGRAHLFDLATDPGERRDLAAAEPERAARYARCLDARGG
ncbi:MAG TPA: sulfatase-like hydrolase/transferase, partial [Polyangia bacterium]